MSNIVPIVFSAAVVGIYDMSDVQAFEFRCGDMSNATGWGASFLKLNGNGIKVFASSTTNKLTITDQDDNLLTDPIALSNTSFDNSILGVFTTGTTINAIFKADMQYNISYGINDRGFSTAFPGGTSGIIAFANYESSEYTVDKREIYIHSQASQYKLSYPANMKDLAGNFIGATNTTSDILNANAQLSYYDTGTVVELNASLSSANGYKTYLWEYIGTDQNEAIIAEPTAKISFVTINGPNDRFYEFRLTVTEIASGAIDIDSVNIFVPAVTNAYATFVPAIPNFYQASGTDYPQKISLDGSQSSGTGNLTYLWSTTSALEINNPNIMDTFIVPSSFTPALNADAQYDFSLKVTDENLSVDIFDFSIPVTAVIPVTAQATVTYDPVLDIITLDGRNSVNAQTYQWTYENGQINQYGFIENSDQALATVTNPTQTGTFTFRLVVTHSYESYEEASEILEPVAVFPPAQLTAIAAIDMVSGLVTLDASESIGVSLYAWSTLTPTLSNDPINDTDEVTTALAKGTPLRTGGVLEYQLDTDGPSGPDQTTVTVNVEALSAVATADYDETANLITLTGSASTGTSAIGDYYLWTSLGGTACDIGLSDNEAAYLASGLSGVAAGTFDNKTWTWDFTNDSSAGNDPAAPEETVVLQTGATGSGIDIANNHVVCEVACNYTQTTSAVGDIFGTVKAVDGARGNTSNEIKAWIQRESNGLIFI